MDLLNPWFCRTGTEDFFVLFDAPQGSDPWVFLTRPDGNVVRVNFLDPNPAHRAMYFGRAANMSMKLLWSHTSDGSSELWNMQWSGSPGFVNTGTIMVPGFAGQPYRTMSTFVDGLAVSRVIWDRLVLPQLAGGFVALAIEPSPNDSTNPPTVEPAPNALDLIRALTHPSNPQWTMEAYTDLRPVCGQSSAPPAYAGGAASRRQEILNEMFEALGDEPPEVDYQQ